MIAVAGGLLGAYAVVVVAFGFSPDATDVGYMPKQPIAYSHALHAGEMGMDCTYCHNSVHEAAHANVPPTQVCLNCHANIGISEARAWILEPLYTAAAEGKPIEWVKIHDLPDYSYFNHSAHVNKGIGCVTCHGRVDRMEVVYQAEPLSMQWCLDCHRNPERYVRPVEEVTNMSWEPDEPQEVLGQRLVEQYNINPSTDCSTCHR